MNSNHLKERTLLLYVATLCVFATGNCMGAIDAGISKISDMLNVSSTTGIYIGSVASLASLISCLTTGMVAGKKIPYKPFAVACGIGVVVFGCAGYFASTFAGLLVFRGLFGLCSGAAMSIQNPIATKLIPQDRLAFILGVGTSVGFSLQCIMQLLGGILADIQWNYVFLVHLIIIIPTIALVILLPKMKVDTPEPPKQKSIDSSHQSSKRQHLPFKAFLTAVVMFIVCVMLAPILYGSAFLVAEITPSATWAGAMAMFFSIGVIIGGVIYSWMHKVLRRFNIAFYFIFGGIALFICGYTSNIPLMIIGFVFSGIIHAAMCSSAMLYLGQICTPQQLGFASALEISFRNLGSFTTASWESLVGLLTGDPLHMPLYLGGIVWILLGICFLIKPPFGKDGMHAV